MIFINRVPQLEDGTLWTDLPVNNFYPDSQFAYDLNVNNGAYTLFELTIADDHRDQFLHGYLGIIPERARAICARKLN